jgi:hypothetical protein
VEGLAGRKITTLAGIQKDGKPHKVQQAFIDEEAPGWHTLTSEDFAKVNSAENTWAWKDGVLHCTGQPVSVMRTARQFTNFEMVVEWMHEKSAGNSGVFLWATPESIEKLTTAGKPGLPAGIEVQVLDHGYTEKVRAQGGKTDWFGTNGDVFPVRVKLKPFPPLSPDGSRSFPTERHSRGTPEWNHYFVRAVDGEVRLWVNGHQVSGGAACNPKDSIAREPFIVAADIDGGRGNARLRRGAAVDANHIAPVLGDDVDVESYLTWDKSRDDLVLKVTRKVGSLRIDERDLAPVPGDDTTEALLERVRATSMKVLGGANDADSLRHDPLFKLANGRLPDAVAP